MWSDSASGKERRQDHFPVKYKKAEGKFPLPADNDRQHPHPQPLFPHSRSSTIMIQQLSPFPHPPQQKRSRIIQRQLSFPQPLPELRPQPLPPQQHSNKMIQRMEPHPPSLQEHPPPQFVAAKSLILNPPNFSYTVSYGIRKDLLQIFLKQLLCVL